MKKPNILQRIILPSFWKDPAKQEPLTGEHIITYSLCDDDYPITGSCYYDRETSKWYHDIMSENPISEEVLFYAELPKAPKGFDVADFPFDKEDLDMMRLIKEAVKPGIWTSISLKNHNSELDLRDIELSIGKRVIVKFKKLHERAVLPVYAKPGDAGMDLFPVSSETIDGNIVCSFGFAMEIPEGFVGLIFPRSGIYKHSYTMSNSVGVVDSGYRGEVKAIFKKFNNYAPSFYDFGQAVAQLIVMPYPKVETEWVERLTDTVRGTGGFGHTDKR